MAEIPYPARPTTDYYVLDANRNPVPADLQTWALRFGQDRHVALDEENGVRVSTVFLGLNHRYFGEGPPIVFETMIFGGRHDQWQERWSTWSEAEAGHARALAMVRETP